MTTRATVTDATFDALIAPLTVDELLDEYWERRPVFIKGHPDKVAGLFGTDDLVTAIGRQHDVGLMVRASFDREDGPSGVSRHLAIDSTDAAAYWDQGASLCVDPADAADENLADLAAAAKRRLGHLGAVSVKCYLSPDGAGFNPHFDAHVTTAIQLEGRKRWRYSTSPAVSGPTHNAFVDDHGAVRYNDRAPSSLRDWEKIGPMAEAEIEEVVLEPGDVLCLPSGTWHEAKALEYSLALNLAFDPLPFVDLLAAALTEATRDDAGWRLGLPPSPPSDSGLPPRVRDAATHRLQDAIRILEGFLGDETALASVWREALDHRPRPVPPMMTTPVPSAPSSSPTAPATSSRGFDGGLSASLTVGDIDAAVAWYQDIFGGDVVSAVPEFGWAELTTPVSGIRLGLAEVATDGVTGGAVLNFGVDDLDAMRQRLEDHGVTFDGPTRTIVGMVRLAGFTDPFGNRLMMYQPLSDDGGASQ